MPGKEKITFPPGVLGAGPIRLPLLARTSEFFAVSKPLGVGVSADPLHPDVPLLLDALCGAIASGKRQMEDLGIRHAGRVHGLDPELTGVTVFAASKESESRLRNALGSREIEFVFELLVEALSDEQAVTCDLPLARNTGLHRVFVSHVSGKKCSTIFEPVRRLGSHALWEARTTENRPHQVRIHAAESGFRVPGERIYSRVALIHLSDLKRGYRPGKRAETPLYPSVCIHLRKVTLQQSDGTCLCIEAPRSRAFEATLKRVERHTGGGRPAPED